MTSPKLSLIASMVVGMEKTSTDKDTQVGCVITNSDGHVMMTGSNHHTINMGITEENTERPEKYDWIEHAERNAIYHAAKDGIALRDSVMYLPGFPCVECARAIAQSGIDVLFHGSTDGWDEERYKFSKSKNILRTAGVKLIEWDVHKHAKEENQNV